MAALGRNGCAWYNMNEIKKILELITDIEELALEHCNPLACDSETSPDDMEAHRNGLIVQKCNEIKSLLLEDGS